MKRRLPQLYIDPHLVRRCRLDLVLGVKEQRRSRHIPLVTSEQQNVGAGAVHFVRLPGVNRFLLHLFDT